MTFSLALKIVTLPSAASVNPRGLLEDAADRNDSVAKDALVMPSITGLPCRLSAFSKQSVGVGKLRR